MTKLNILVCTIKQDLHHGKLTASKHQSPLKRNSDEDVTGRQLQRQCHPERLLHCQEPSPTEWVLQTEQQQVNPFAKELPERGATPSVRQVLRGKV